MKTVKTSRQFLGEIEKLNSSGSAFSSKGEKISSDGVDTLPTAKEYVSQTKDILKLMELFRMLILKDTEDLFQLYETIEIMDEQIGRNF